MLNASRPNHTKLRSTTNVELEFTDVLNKTRNHLQTLTYNPVIEVFMEYARVPFMDYRSGRISAKLNWKRRDEICQMIRDRDAMGTYDKNGNTLTGDLELTTNDLAALLCVTPMSVVSWRAKGNDPPFIVSAGNVRFYRLRDIRHWAATTQTGMDAVAKMRFLSDPFVERTHGTGSQAVAGL